jgi:hypothetical protein
MEKVIPVDIYNKEGDLTAIEFNQLDGTFVIQAEWDPREDQNSENRIAFRKWAYNMIENIGYEVMK